MDKRHQAEVELFRAMPVEQLAQGRELNGFSPSFLGEVLFLIYASYGSKT